MLVVYVRAVGTVELPTVLFDDPFKFLESHRVPPSEYIIRIIRIKVNSLEIFSL